MTAVAFRSDLPTSTDLVVVGGGIVGAATAFFAARAGVETVVVEARAQVATLTTPASTGAFRLQFDNEEEWHLVGESVDVFARFEEVTGQDRWSPSIQTNGYLFCTTTTTGADRHRRVVEMQHGWGQTDIELLDGDEARRRFPHLAGEVVSARFRAGDGFLDPVAVTYGFLAGAGVPVVTDCRVISIDVEGDSIVGVTTSRGRVAARQVVVAAGPFSSVLLASLGVTLPVVAVNRQKVVLPDLPEVPSAAPMTIDDDTGTHWRPFLRGAAVLFTDPATPPSDPTWTVPADPEHARSLLDPDSPQAAARLSPFWRQVWERGGAQWTAHTGQYVVTPDHRPLLGPVGPEGLFVNTGYSGHGIMGSPAGSRHLVDVLTGVVRDNPFAVDRTMGERERDVL